MKGFVKFDGSDQIAIGAMLHFEDLATGKKLKPVKSSDQGEYWKLLMPGEYRYHVKRFNT